jgi:hypothetical protein
MNLESVMGDSLEVKPLLPFLSSLPTSFLEDRNIALKLMETIVLDHDGDVLRSATPQELAIGVMIKLIFEYEYSFVAHTVAKGNALKFMLQLYNRGELEMAVASILKSTSTIH